MKKKIALLLSVLSCVLMLGACGTDPTTVDYNGYTYKDLYSQTYSVATALSEAPKADIEKMLVEMQAYDPEGYWLDIELCEKWLAAMEEAGSYVGVVKDSFSVDKAGKTVTTNIVLEFEKRDVNFQLVYAYHTMDVTGVTVEPVYSLGEKMITAGMNTLICVSIVFIVLIGISLIIACFNIFPYLEAKKKEKENAKAANVSDLVVTQIEKREEIEQTDDTELIAVIAAAIAASEGCSTSDFVVRSIVRR